MLLQNVVFDNVKHKLYVLCVRCACEMRIDVSRTLVVDIDEEFCNVLSGSDVITFRTCVCVCVCVENDYYMYIIHVRK